jgi:D-3-phosphoglycerate dehydrogenase
MKILANDGIAESGKIALEEKGFTVITEKVEQEKLIDAINQESYEVLLVRSATKVREELIDACPGLKMIGRGGVGMDNIDVAYARSKGIEVFNTPAASSESVAELVMAHLFGAVRFLYESNRQMPVVGNSDFKKLKKAYAGGIELSGKTMGIIGFGRIGQALGKYAIGCGMKVVFYDRYVDSAKLSMNIHGTDLEVSVPKLEMNELLNQADFISLHVPGGDQPVIGKAEFDQMKDGAILVNAARGGVVDEQALMDALDAGKLAHAALDVFVNEPTPSEAILKHDKISLSPHIGAATAEAQDRIGTELAENIISFYNKVNA